MITIISFGYLHGAAPEADRTEDLRRRYRDPARAAGLLDLNYDDPRVRDAVLGTAGVTSLLENLFRNVCFEDAQGRSLTVAVGCAGGKHRAPVVAEELARLLYPQGVRYEIGHRDAHRPRVLADKPAPSTGFAPGQSVIVDTVAGPLRGRYLRVHAENDNGLYLCIMATEDVGWIAKGTVLDSLAELVSVEEG